MSEMIFSKEKEPKSPGWYHYRFPTFNKIESIAMVTPDSTGELYAVVSKGSVRIIDKVADMSGLWGDRVKDAK